MPDTWPDATFGPLGAALGVLVLSYFLLVEPLLGRWALRRLRARRPRDPDALLSFYRLTVGCLWAAAGAALVVVAVELGLEPRDVGLAWPVLQPLSGLVGGLVVGGSIGVCLNLVAGVVAARGDRSDLPVSPQVALLLPGTRRERRWAAVVSVTAGICEEVVFRGLFLAMGVGLFGLSPLAAAALSSVAFGLAHVYQGPAGVLATTMLGAVFAALALATQSLLLPVVLHTLVDLRALLLTARPAGPRPPA